MMDPLSISASIIALLQATSTLVSLCYEFRACLNNAPWSLSRITEEVKSLRAVLETLEDLALSKIKNDAKRKGVFELLCDSEYISTNLDLALLVPENDKWLTERVEESGPLVCCERELEELEGKILGRGWVEKAGGLLGGRESGRRRALVKAVGWKLKDGDAREFLGRIERWKNMLSLAISADEATLLLEIHRLNEGLSRDIRDIGDTLGGLVDHLKVKDMDEKQQAMMQWLSPVNSWESHEAAKHTHQTGTSDWLLKSKAFIDWQQADRSFLLLTGFPGSGKTILFSTVVEHLGRLARSCPGEPYLAYFYCDFRRPDSTDPVNVFGSLVAQLCSQLEWFPEDLEAAFKQNSTGGAKRRPSLSDLEAFLKSIADKQHIFLLIDALDECDKRNDTLEAIANLEDADRLSMLISSRAETEIRSSLMFFQELSLQKHLQAMDQDICKYIDHRLESDRKLLWLNPAIKIDIIESLHIKSQGMFRWVQCQLDEIESLRTVKAIRVALKELPRGLDETYERILLKVSESDHESVRKILLWLSFAVLPLTLEELHTAIAIEQDMEELDEDSLLSSHQDILSMCGSLVTLSEQGDVKLAHLSVKDYLLSSNACVPRFALSPIDGNRELALDCLTYLSYKTFSNGPCQTKDEYIERIAENPFIHHSAVGWTYYIRATSQSGELEGKTMNFFETHAHKTFMSWVQVLNAGDSLQWNFYPRHATPLYYAASFGLTDMVIKLISRGVNLDAPGSRFGGTALHAAVLRNHLDAMKILLDAGADANKGDFNCITPLRSALGHGEIEAAAMLLEHGASRVIGRAGETMYERTVLVKRLETAEHLLLGISTERVAVMKETDIQKITRHRWTD